MGNQTDHPLQEMQFSARQKKEKKLDCGMIQSTETNPPDIAAGIIKVRSFLG